MLFKNLLVGVGSAGIIGVGGYGIYSTTRSSGEDSEGTKKNRDSKIITGQNENKDNSSPGTAVATDKKTSESASSSSSTAIGKKQTSKKEGNPVSPPTIGQESGNTEISGDTAA